MRRWLALAIAVLTGTAAHPARADGSLSSEPSFAKRTVPDYGGPKAQPDRARAIALWVPRLVLSPLYLVTEYGIRLPLSAVLPAAEEAELPRKVRDAFLFAPDHKGGILPVGYADFGFNPSVGAYAFWHDAFAPGNEWSVHGEAWPTDWYALSLKEGARLDGSKTLRVQLSGLHRPDRVFYGVGPESLQSSQSRYTDAVADESVTFDWKYWRESHLQLGSGLRSVSLGPGHYGNDPTVGQEAATGAFAIPYGYDSRYTAEYNRVVASVDSRQPVPMPGSGARVEARVEQGSDVQGTPASGWVRYAATAAGFVDLDEHRHVLSLSAAVAFADPLGSRPVPYTELASLGGEEPMLGYLPRRLVGRSAAVVAAHYTWPIAPFFGGTLEAAVGNVFDEHLAGFRADLLRFSGDVGITTVGVADYPIEAIVGIGSETFAHGGQIDSVRVKLSVNHGF